METFSKRLNDMLVSVYHNILRVEEEFLKAQHRVNLTIRETHIIEYIGERGENGVTLGEIAGYLNVARPTVTVAARKLEDKGYLSRSAGIHDGRYVRVMLTRDGIKVYKSHKGFHMAMVHELEHGFDEREKELLIRVMEKLDGFFERSVGAAV